MPSTFAFAQKSNFDSLQSSLERTISLDNFKTSNVIVKFGGNKVFITARENLFCQKRQGRSILKYNEKWCIIKMTTMKSRQFTLAVSLVSVNGV
jgi:hypothetical protein